MIRLISLLLVSGCVSEGVDNNGGPGTFGGGKADGAAMTVHVPAGPFVYTTTLGDVVIDGSLYRTRIPDLTPDIPAFDVDLHEVTNEQWAACVAANVCAPGREFGNGFFRLVGYATAAEYADFPAVAVTTAEAAAYCAWAGGRLPTAHELIKAGRGGCEYAGPVTCGREDIRSYPWAGPDNAYDYVSPRFAVLDTSTPSAVGSRSPLGDSPYGAQDIVGNVAELVDADEGTVALGGSMFDDGLLFGNLDSQSAFANPDAANVGTGFRCAY